MSDGTVTAGLACAACGTALRANAKFCDECGSPLAAPGTAAEYKHVTVLFADVVHSMDIASRLGAERLREIMTELVERASTVVQRYGGTVDKFTGDGIMTVFGAPVALEDHAIRACLAALDIQKETERLAAEVERTDGVALQLRIGLNSGQVIAGEIGSGSWGYTAIGEQVGMAQRMESVAPPGGVMLSESTARLVEANAVLGKPEMVPIKGVAQPVPARCLLGVETHRRIDRAFSTFVGRHWEISALTGILDQSIAGKGCVVSVVGPPGIGKSRIVLETTALANRRGVEVFNCYCESHTSEIPFHAVAGLLRAAFGVSDLDAAAARAQVRTRVSDADSEDVVLLEDLLGIGDPNVALPQIDPDARRRRLTSLVNAASLARTTPAVYVIEDAHWIDEVSESMLADFLSVAPRTPSLVLITYRPEYAGALAHTPRSQTIALEPLDDSDISGLTAELVGSDTSVAGIVDVIANRAAGNPFFAEEIVRDLTERGVLVGERGAYTCSEELADVSVPGTLQAAIAARIDRLDPAAKRTLNAAAVVGSRFSFTQLETLGIDPALDELVRAELVDQIVFTQRAEYVFRHPLIRSVAYDSQLKSDRAQSHRRLAAAIEQHDQNAALIAEHLAAARDMRAAYEWHMRAGVWSTNRDIAAARVSWERAVQIADALPTDDPDHTAMRIAPRTMLCSHVFRGMDAGSSQRFAELRELCTAADDKASLAIGMAGLAMEYYVRGRVREASQQVSEYMVLVESIGDPTLTLGLGAVAIVLKILAGDLADGLRWSQTVVSLADGDPTKGGNLIFESPLAVALVMRGIAHSCMGHPGWREDLASAVELARGTDPVTHGAILAWMYGFSLANGVLLVDDSALREIDEALRIAEASADDTAVGLTKYVLGLALVNRDASAERERGREMLAQVRDMCLHGRFFLSELPAVDFWAAYERACQGHHDDALPIMRQAVAHMFGTEQLLYYVPGASIFAETLLDRGAEDDVEEVETTISRLAAAPADDDSAAREIWLLRLHALLARARGDEVAFRDFADRYRAMATSLGFEGHMAWAGAMA
ncbi:AAA family ATPase [Mycobacterium fragae]|uniref:Cyclase n=1 Tax=Mycobacterium fragae TaxID=1260918 RepID=A0A1X1UJW7_9MYCO|nr:adenylate/guanylate cyclase domain-containing protein [Mycobacterium fragae]MCV7400942.1 AAA family ATPase [Mycobacterium fragae]ORV57082.1 cyclase [Mycobacterium fragae]